MTNTLGLNFSVLHLDDPREDFLFNHSNLSNPYKTSTNVPQSSFNFFHNETEHPLAYPSLNWTFGNVFNASTSIEHLMVKCSEEIQLWFPAYRNLSAEEQIHIICDYCLLSEWDLDLLYSDQTCVKSHFDPIALFCIMYAVLFVLGVVGNIGVLVAVLREGRLQTSVMHLFIASLAVGDLLTAILCIPFTMVPVMILHHWPFGELLCTVISYLQVSILKGLKKMNISKLHYPFNALKDTGVPFHRNFYSILRKDR